MRLFMAILYLIMSQIEGEISMYEECAERTDRSRHLESIVPSLVAKME